MHSVTSGAVYSALNAITSQFVNWNKCHYGGATFYKFGKVVFFSAPSDWYEVGSGYTYDLINIPYGYRPIAEVKLSEATKATNVVLIISAEGSSIYCYNYLGAINWSVNGQYYGCWITNQ